MGSVFLQKCPHWDNPTCLKSIAGQQALPRKLRAAHIKIPIGKRASRLGGSPRKEVLVVTPSSHNPTREVISR